jgi:hypothetical protein
MTKLKKDNEMMELKRQRDEIDQKLFNLKIDNLIRMGVRDEDDFEIGVGKIVKENFCGDSIGGKNSKCFFGVDLFERLLDLHRKVLVVKEQKELN